MGLFSKERTVNRVCLIPVESIHPNPDQPRRIFHGDELKALADSIKANGLLQPITLIREDNGSYQIVAGERRFIACQQIGMTAVPAIICDITATDAAVLALIENIQRSDLNFMEEANAIQQLIQKLSITQEQVAKRLGRSQSSIANKLRLLRLPEDIQRQLIDGGLTERHARALLRLPEEQMSGAVGTMVEQSMNVAQAEALVEQLLNEKNGHAMEERNPAASKGKRIFVVKDLRVFTNTINRAVQTMREAGIQAFSETTEHDCYVEYVVRIPKDMIYRKKKSS